jgi:hypothetical protein
MIKCEICILEDADKSDPLEHIIVLGYKNGESKGKIVSDPFRYDDHEARCENMHKLIDRVLELVGLSNAGKE